MYKTPRNVTHPFLLRRCCRTMIRRVKHWRVKHCLPHDQKRHMLKFWNFKKSIFKLIDVAQILAGRCLLSPTGSVLAVTIVSSKLSTLQMQSRRLERILLDRAKRQLKAQWQGMTLSGAWSEKTHDTSRRTAWYIDSSTVSSLNHKSVQRFRCTFRNWMLERKTVFWTRQDLRHGIS